MDERPTAWGIFRRGENTNGLLTGPHGLLYDRAVAEQVARQLYGDSGVVQATNPDHMGQWGYGQGSPHSPYVIQQVKVGDEVLDLLFGEHPHSRSDNSIYARFSSGAMVGFNGHRLLHDITFHDVNYLKTSGISGNEVRGSGMATITINDSPCGFVTYRDIFEGLLAVRARLRAIHDLPFRAWDARDRDAMTGKEIFYHNTPAIITIADWEYMEVNISPEKGHDFPKTPWQSDDSYREMGSLGVRDSMFSPHIWWFRNNTDA